MGVYGLLADCCCCGGACGCCWNKWCSKAAIWCCCCCCCRCLFMAWYWAADAMSGKISAGRLFSCRPMASRIGRRLLWVASADWNVGGGGGVGKRLARGEVDVERGWGLCWTGGRRNAEVIKAVLGSGKGADKSGGGGGEVVHDAARFCLLLLTGCDTVGRGIVFGALFNVPVLRRCPLSGIEELWEASLDLVFAPPAPLALVRLRFLITSVLRLSGRTTPCSLRNRPQALHNGCPSGFLRHKGVVVVPQFVHFMFLLLLLLDALRDCKGDDAEAEGDGVGGELLFRWPASSPEWPFRPSSLNELAVGRPV